MSGLRLLLPRSDSDQTLIPPWAGQFNCPTGFIHTTHSSGEDAWVPRGCHRNGCPECWKSRAMQARLSVFAHLTHHAARNMWLWTTSVRNEDDLNTAFESLTKVETRFRKADEKRRRRGNPHMGEWIRTWIGVYEVKRSDDASWNVHSHKIVVSDDKFIGPRYTQKINGIFQAWGYGRFDQWWKQAAGDPSAHSDFSGPSHSPHAGTAYLTKYLGKDSGIWGSMSESEAIQFGSCLGGRRFLRRPRGSKPPEVPSAYVYCCDTITRESCYYERL